MKVTLEKIQDKDELGGEIEHAVRLVYVQHDALKRYNEEGRIHIGVIGTHAGANFIPNNEFNRMLGEKNREAVVAEVKRLHGKASPERHVELPPLMEVVDEGE